VSAPRIFPVRAAATGPSADPVPRGLTVCWGLLYFNGMAWINLPTVPFPLPMRVGQAIAYGSLGISLLLALRLNPRLLVRANAILVLYSSIWVLGLLSSMRLESGFGAFIRCGRLAGFLAIAWLLTPYWGQPRMPLLRAHLRVLWIVVGSIVVGLILFPGRARAGYGVGDARLIGTLWPIAPTQVGLHSAMLVGFSTALWLSGVLPRRWMFAAVGIGVPAIFLSGTRTALAALLVGTGCSALSVLVGRVQVRRLLARVLLASPLIVAAFAVIIPLWATRGQDAEQITQLTGRTKVWTRMLNQERDTLTQWIGVGLTDKGYEGLSIDNLWLSVFQDIGYVGVGLIAAIMLVLAGSVVMRGPSPGRAVGAFIVPYLLISSITEVGLGDASVYVLHALVTASVLQAPLGRHGQRLRGNADDLPVLQWPAPTGSAVLTGGPVHPVSPAVEPSA
jgi:hypothetical protein